MRLVIFDQAGIRMYLESRTVEHRRGLVLTIEGTKSTRDVHRAYATAEHVLPRGIKVARVDVQLDELGAKAVKQAQRKRGQPIQLQGANP
jgi:Mn-dependent DtxR family transcriptional regulator